MEACLVVHYDNDRTDQTRRSFLARHRGLIAGVLGWRGDPCVIGLGRQPVLEPVSSTETDHPEVVTQKESSEMLQELVVVALPTEALPAVAPKQHSGKSPHRKAIGKRRHLRRLARQGLLRRFGRWEDIKLS